MERTYINKNFPHFLHGADYNPEQWIETKEIWDQDMALMRLANCNEMTVGIFSWAMLEPEEGVYDFSFLDEIIDKVYENGGRVVLATPTGARPRWMAEKYPEVLRVNQLRQRESFRARHNHCYTSPVYREKVRQMNSRLAQRYGKHPAVVAWHLSNEYGGMCYCDKCQNAFREYLKKRYNGDIGKLNHAYWSTFWSHKLDSFDQIEAPSPLTDESMHGLNLDWRRFVTHQTKDFIDWEISSIREYEKDLPVTTNMMYDFYDLDYWQIAESLDVISWDDYPEWHNGDQIRTAAGSAFWHDMYRSLKNRPFMLMESAPGLVNWKPINKLKRPGMDKLGALQAVAHGSDTVQYFQWRKSRGSVEKFHGAVVDHVGTSDTRIFKAVQETGAALQKIDEVVGSHVKARVAMVFDWPNRWALDDAQAFMKDNKGYFDTCLDYYRFFWDRGINVDMTGVHKDWSGYDLVILPMLYMVSQKTARRIEEYVKNGGHVYATYTLGMVDETDLCHLGGFPCGGLKEVFGIWNEEADTLYPEERVLVDMDGTSYEGKDICELIHANTAQVLARYGSEFYKDMPALTVNSFGCGKAWYQTFRDTGAFKEQALMQVIRELGIAGALANLPTGVTAHTRQAEGVTYLFVENYTENPVENLPLGGSYTNLETGEKQDYVNLLPFGIQIFKA